MSEGGYKIRNQAEAHFITFVVVEWVDDCCMLGSFKEQDMMMVCSCEFDSSISS